MLRGGCRFHSSLPVLITSLFVCLSVATKRNSIYGMSKQEKDEEPSIGDVAKGVSEQRP